MVYQSNFRRLQRFEQTASSIFNSSFQNYVCLSVSRQLFIFVQTLTGESVFNRSIDESRKDIQMVSDALDERISDSGGEAAQPD